MSKAKRAPSSQTAGDTAVFAAEPARLIALIPDLRAYFDALLTFSASELNSFSGTEWGRLILSIILGFRLSFPIPDCPDWDDGWAREEIGLGEYLRRFENMGGEPEKNGSMDILTASKVVLGVVRKKWEKRAARLSRKKGQGVGVGVAVQQQGLGEELSLDMGLDANMDMNMDAMLLDKTMQGCPLMDGSLDSYYPLWDESFSSPDMGTLGTMAVDEPGPEDGSLPWSANEQIDIWGTMTAGWAQWPQLGAGFGGQDL